MKKLLSLFVCSLLWIGSAYAANQVYAVWNESTTTLTLYYDDQCSARGGTTAWPQYRQSATKMVLDISMKNAKPTTLYGWFSDWDVLTEIQHLNYLNTSEVDLMFNLFQNNPALKSLDLSSFNTEKVTQMSGMFSGCTSLQSITFGASFNTAKVESMENMFTNCKALKSIDLSSFNTVNVTDMNNMFYNCNSLTSITFGSQFFTAMVTNMNGMFDNCYALISLDLRSFNTRYVGNMSRMFCGCQALRTIQLGKNFTTANVTDMTAMFLHCDVLEAIDLSTFNTAKVTKMEEMFSYCNGLTELNLLTFDFSSAADISNMFKYSENLKTIYCKQDLSSKFAESYIFFGCQALVGGMGTKYDSNKQKGAYAHPDGGSSNPGYFTAKRVYSAFDYLTNTLTYYYDDQFDTREDTVEFYTPEVGVKRFGGYSNLIGKVVIDPSMMYAPLTSLNSLCYGGADDVKLTALMYIEGLENLNTSNITDMRAMFAFCSSLKALDLQSFDMSNVTDIAYMFNNCSSLKTIYTTDDWSEMTNIVSSDDMFDGCTSLEGGLGYKYTSGYSKDKTLARPDQVLSTKRGYFTDDLEVYTSFDESTGILTYYYDRLRSTRPKTEPYTPSSGHDQVRFAGYASIITKVVIDKSFHKARFHSLANMFNGGTNNLTALTQIEGISNIDWWSVKDFYAMFKGCSALTELDLHKPYIDAPYKFEDTRSMFEGCTNLKTIYSTYTWDSDKSDDMFTGCTSLVGGMGTSVTSPYTDISWARPDYGAAQQGYFTKDFIYTYFAGNTLIYYYDDKITSRGVAKFELYLPYEKRFSTYNESIEKVIFDNSMASAPLTSLENLLYGGDDNLKLVNLKRIVDLYKLNTANVTSMQKMFYGCSSLTELDLRGLKVDNLDNTVSMFEGCAELRTIYCNDDWSKNSSIGSYKMFLDCKKLVGGHGYHCDGTIGISHTYARPDVNSDRKGCFTADKLVYSVYDNDTTLTYYYDDIITGRIGAIELYDPEVLRFGAYHNSVKKAVIDASMRDTALTTTKNMFFGGDIPGYALTNLKEIAGLENLNTAEVTSMHRMFAWCQSLPVLDLTMLSFAKVTDMRYMFQQCRTMTTIYCNQNLSGKSSLLSDNMFMDCDALVGSAGTAHATALVDDKLYARIDNGATEPGYFSGVKEVYTVFNELTGELDYRYDCSRGSGPQYELYEPEKGHDRKRFAAYHDKIKKIFINPNFHDVQLTSLANMFDGGSGNELTALEAIEGFEYIDFTKVTDLYAMFAGCSALKQIDLSKFNTEKVTDMSYMFYECKSLKTLSVVNFITTKVSQMNSMFKKCSALESIFCNDDWSSVASSSDMFYGCGKLKGDKGTYCNGVKNIDASYARPDEVTDVHGYFSSYTDELNEELYAWIQQLNDYCSFFTPYVGETDMSPYKQAVINIASYYQSTMATAKDIQKAIDDAKAFIPGSINNLVAKAQAGILAYLQGLLLPDDNDQCKAIVNNAKDQVATLFVWDLGKSVSENTAILLPAVNTLYSDTEAALAAERQKEALKAQLKGYIDDMYLLYNFGKEFVPESEITTYKTVIIKGFEDTYNTGSLQDLQAAVVSAPGKINIEVMVMMNEGKPVLKDSLDHKLLPNDPAECQQIIADAKAAIDGLQWQSGSVESNVTRLDAAIKKIFADADAALAAARTSTGNEEMSTVNCQLSTKKFFRNGQLYIERDGKLYNAAGAEVE